MSTSIKDYLSAEDQEVLKNMENVGAALREYHDIIKDIVSDSDYNDTTTPEELKADHPELDSMDYEEIEDLLKIAKLYRKHLKSNKENSDRKNRIVSTVFYRDKRSGLEAGVNDLGELFLGDKHSGCNLRDTPENCRHIERDFERYTGRRITECMVKGVRLEPLVRMKESPAYEVEFENGYIETFYCEDIDDARYHASDLQENEPEAEHGKIVRLEKTTLWG